MDAIRSGCTRRVLELLENLPADKFSVFWKEFGRVLKEGIAEDHANRERIARLCRFASTHDASEAQTVSLADYVSRMKEGQDKIYFVTAESLRAAASSPHLEIFRTKGIEVLLLHERIDEWLVASLHEFEGKPLASVARGDLDLSKFKSDTPEPDHEVGAYKDLLAKLKSELGDRVKDVRVSHRLTQSPSCLVADENEMGGNLARILRAAGQKVPSQAPILEINPQHQIVARLKPDDARIGDWASLLFDQALLAEGGTLEDPGAFVRRTNDLFLSLNSGTEPQLIPGRSPN